MNTSKRTLECSLRAVDEDTRTATFVAATETPVDTWRGREYLRISGVDLARYQKNPVLLDAHDRYTSDSVIGRGAVRIEGDELLVDATFADTERANVVWQLVRGGFLRAVSVGFSYWRKDTKELDDGENDGAFTGPGVVINKWQLYEISTVPVGADENALKRALGLADEEDVAPVARHLMSYLQRLIPNEPQGDDSMSEKPDEARTQEQGNEPPESEKGLREILEGIAPKTVDLTDVIDRCVLEDMPLSQARAEMSKAFSERAKPAGTPEPQTPKAEPESDERELTPDEVLLALKH